MVNDIGRTAIASEYRCRAEKINSALHAHCFDGEFFSDTLTAETTPTDYSQHCQIWAVLCGAVAGRDAEKLLRGSLTRTHAGEFAPESVSMSFYTMRALSLAGGRLYDENFVRFWEPWCQQLQQNVTTWVEDSVSQRSDCHAWGSVPLYEFMVEVAGIRPLEPGWSALEFRPRIALFPDLKAKVPFKILGSKCIGLFHVSWATDASGNTEVRLRKDLAELDMISVHVSLPQVKMISKLSDREMCFIIENNSIIRHG